MLAAGGLVYGHYKNAAPVVTAVPVSPAVPVGLETAKRQDVVIALTGLGNVQPFQQAVIRSQVDGQLVEVAFREGQDVKVGDVLAKVDPRIYQAAVNQAVAKMAQDQAQLTNARLDETRYQDLVERNFISRQQLDTTRAQVGNLEAAVQGDRAAIDNAKVLLDYTTIRSPLNGRVGMRLVDVGNVVHASDQTGIFNITQLHPISVIFTLPEDQIAQVLNAQKSGSLKVSVLSRDSQLVLDEGHLELVDNQIDPNTAMVKLKAICDNKAGLLWPGEFVNARLVVGMARDAVTVPIDAVQRGQQGTYIWVVDQAGMVQSRNVTIGTVNDGNAVVLNGLQAGETVVTSGQYRLRAGVAVVAAAASKAPPQ